MADLLTNLGLVATWVLGFVSDVAEVIIGSPLMILTVAVMMLGAAVGIFGRLLSRG